MDQMETNLMETWSVALLKTLKSTLIAQFKWEGFYSAKTLNAVCPSLPLPLFIGIGRSWT